LRHSHGRQRICESWVFHCVSSKSEWTDTNTGALYLREEHRIRDHQRRSICDGWSLWLEAVAVGMIILQVLDACVGVAISDRMKTFGPAGIAVTNLAALVWLISR
jgi:hypothetical protein